MHPLLQLIATRPALLAEHAEAYAALISAELPRISAAWRRRALLNLLALACATVGVLLAGVGAMLWAVTPEVPLRAAWALLVVPMLPLLASAALWTAARLGGESESLRMLRQQFAADVQLLREAART